LVVFFLDSSGGSVALVMAGGESGGNDFREHISYSHCRLLDIASTSTFFCFFGCFSSASHIRLARHVLMTHVKLS